MDYKVYSAVIFLDFDGVLHTLRNLEYMHRMKLSNRDNYGFIFDPICIANLKTLVDKTGAKLVISSSWRLKGIDHMCQMWIDRQLPGEIIGVTPKLTLLNCKYDCPRGMEIFAWMEDRKNDIGIKNYVIIDDKDDVMYAHRNNFVQTTWRNGLEKEELQLALTILGR